jgi:copper homeostasis protein
MITCEVCVEGVPGALGAQEGGAQRIELCAGLVEGGTTPSIGTISRVLDTLSIPTVVLIRPRGGDFLYEPDELEALLRDVEAVKKAGAFGIATGALTRDGDVDRVAMAEVMKAAGPLSVTFHRAFDMTRQPSDALETLVQLGVDRVLTSGQERSVPEGLALIRKLAGKAGGRISIMPGGGVTEANVAGIIRQTGVREVHFTAFRSLESPMVHRNPRPLMGGDRVPGEYERLATDPNRVRRFLDAAENSS